MRKILTLTAIAVLASSLGGCWWGPPGRAWGGGGGHGGGYGDHGGGGGGPRGDIVVPNAHPLS